MNLSNNNRAIWYILTVIGVAATLHIVPLFSSSPMVAEVRNSLHSPAFAILAAALLVSVSRIRPFGQSLIWALGLSILVGCAGETAQYLSYGQASISDIGRDLVGIAAGLVVVLLVGVGGRSGVRPRFVISRRILALLLITAITLPVFFSARTLAQSAFSLPSILSFEQEWERKAFWPANGSTIIIDRAPDFWEPAGGNVALVAFSADKYSGIEIDPTSDWTGYEALSFSVASADGRDHELTLRIDDERHNSHYQDRFGRVIAVTPQKNIVRIPLAEIRDAPNTRNMDLGSIRAVIFSIENPAGDELILLDDIRLDSK